LLSCSSHGFPEDVEESSIAAQLEEILVETKELVKNARTAEVLRKGINLVIAGRPNVGKSSLMNALVGMERSIVSQIPGTTRDYVEQYTVLGKKPVNVVDTAGLRHTDDPIEQEGVKLALSRIAEADWLSSCMMLHWDGPRKTSRCSIWFKKKRPSLWETK